MRAALLILVLAVPLPLACGEDEATTARSFRPDDLPRLVRGAADVPESEHVRVVVLRTLRSGDLAKGVGIAPAFGLTAAELRTMGVRGGRQAVLFTSDESDEAEELVLLVNDPAQADKALDLLRARLREELHTDSEDDAAELRPLATGTLGDESTTYGQQNGDIEEGRIMIWRDRNAVFLVWSSPKWGDGVTTALAQRADEIR